MSALLQDVAVSVVALAAAGMIVRRAVALFQPRPGQAPCGSCASGCASNAGRNAARTDDGRRIIRPIVVDASRSRG